MTLGTTVSIIIPILNEAQTLPQLLANLVNLKPAPQQVILIDGGSTDKSIDIAKDSIHQLTLDHPQISQTAWHVGDAQAGRASQMNAGAALATSDVLLFLHADTLLPPQAIAEIKALMTDRSWGRFDVQLDSPQPLLRLVGSMINLRSRLTGIATGDQAIFVRREVFERLGGYPDQALMEDIELCKRLKAIASPACLRTKVVTSARRWQQHGTWRTIVLMWQLRFDYWRGVSAETIKQRYYH